MADGKKSFVLYCDLIHTVTKMPPDKAGELFFTILRYVNDENPEVNDLIVDLVFEPIKQQLKRDLIEWESERKNRSESGRKGGLKSGEIRGKRKQKEAALQKDKQKEAKGSSASKNEANEAVTATANVTVKDNVTDKSNGSIPIAATAAVGDEKVKLIANKAWSNKLWREQICMNLSITQTELKKWMAGFNSNIASDSIHDFDEARYKRMLRGWIAKQQEKGISVETNLSKKSDSAPLTILKP